MMKNFFASLKIFQTGKTNLKKNKAFSLAEVLIVAMILGFITVFVLPTLLQTVQEKLYSNQRKVFKGKLQEALRQMRVNDVLSHRFNKTEDFVNALSKYVKIVQICPKDSIEGCFAEEINKNELTVLYKASELETAKDIGAPEDFYKLNGEDFDTELVGVRFNDGSSAIIGYSPKCIVANSFDSTADDFYCISMIYDVNGAGQGTNILNQDLGYINALTSTDTDSEYIVGDITISKPFTTNLVTVSECERMKDGNYPIDETCKRNEYWADAVKQCYDAGKRLPTMDELTTIANRLYGAEISKSGTTGSADADGTALQVEDTDLQALLPLGSYWSSEVDPNNSTTHAKYRVFEATSTTADSHIRNDSAVQAFCVNQ